MGDGVYLFGRWCCMPPASICVQLSPASHHIWGVGHTKWRWCTAHMVHHCHATSYKGGRRAAKLVHHVHERDVITSLCSGTNYGTSES